MTPCLAERPIQRWATSRLLTLAALLMCACQADPSESPLADEAESAGDAGSDALAETAEDASRPDLEPTPPIVWSQTEGPCEGDDASLERPAGWGVVSHCRAGEAELGYSALFREDGVHRVEIEISPEQHQATMEDLDTKLSGGGPGSAFATVEKPIWVTVTLRVNGLTWQHVGMRYKGNSSLKSAWARGVRKLAFRLHFDKFEDDHPEIEDQRFFGFRKMTFSNGFEDPSLIRDKLAADLFRAGGVPSARGAFARVSLDHGEGPIYLGLYTMIEDPSDRMAEAQLGSNEGNLYKPEGEGATWQRFVQEHFEKKNNEQEADWSDVQAAIDALHADRGDAPGWREALEERFDVDGFLDYLALNQSMVNWDSYGFMAHNYYLYGDPANDGRLRWIPWDLNEAMRFKRGPGEHAGSVLLDELDESWPLIRYLLDDSSYRDRYRAKLHATLDGPFALETLLTTVRGYHRLIAPHVVGPEGEAPPYTFLRDEQAFWGALSEGSDALESHLEGRHEAVLQALDTEVDR